MKKIAPPSKSGTAKIVLPSGVPSACYIYGILDLGQKVVLKKSRAMGQGTSAKIYTIPFEDISALVSRTQYVQYDPSEKNLLIHNDALQEARSTYRCSILPLRFSTVAKSEGDVMKILSSGHSKFKEKLAFLNGKLEIATKVYCKIDELKQSIIARRGKGGKEDHQSTDDALKKESYELANGLLKILEPMSVKHQLNDLIFDDMIMNAAFLLEEREVKGFVDAVKSYEEEHGRYLKIQISGPYVPYSFTDPEDGSERNKG